MRNTSKVETFRKVSLLLSSGIGLRRVLSGLHKEGHEQAKTMLDALHDGSSVGVSFGAGYSLSGHERVLLDVGQRLGVLPEVMKQIADQQEEAARFKADAYKALLRPVITLGLAFLVMLFVLYYITPAFEDTKSTAMTIPAFLRQFLPYSAAAGLFAIVSGIIVYYQSRATFWRLVCLLPFAGDMMLDLFLYQFFSVVAMMRKRGIGTIEAMSKAAAESNIYIDDRMSQAIVSMREGGSLKTAIVGAFEGKLPFYVIDMLDNIRQTGEFDALLGQIAMLLKADFGSRRDKVVPFAEMSAYLVGGLVVALAAWSFIGPMRDKMSGLMTTGRR
jgi:type II secretory pathway component PulF